MVATIEPELEPIIPSVSAVKLMRSGASEILFEGPAGTGKTYSLALYARILCETYPGIKILFIRQTRKSLNASLLDIWEEEILGHGHPACTPIRAKESRQHYDFPFARTMVDGIEYAGRSRVDLVGMDSPDKIMSTQYDAAFFVEATEGFLGAWARIGSRLRRFHVQRFGRPWSLQVADCNPAHATHWLNVRADQRIELDADIIAQLGEEVQGQKSMYRLKTNLKDNPKFWSLKDNEWTPEGLQYNMTLSRLPPIERARYKDGKWVSQSGQVYPTYTTDKHLVNGKLVKRDQDYGRWRLEPVVGKAIWGNETLLEADFKPRLVAYFVAAVDWGYQPDPGSAGLYAVDDHGRAFRVKSMYRTCKPAHWWAAELVAWQKKYNVRSIVCDGPREKVDVLNELMGNRLNDQGAQIAMLAPKGSGSILAGIDIVRWALQDDDLGEPRIRFFTDSLEHEEDPLLKEIHKPTDLVREFDGYVFPERKDDGPNKAVPKDMDNHGMDELRYMMTHLFGNTYRATPPPPDPRLLNPLFVAPNLAAERKIALEAAGFDSDRRNRRPRRR